MAAPAFSTDEQVPPLSPSSPYSPLSSFQSPQSPRSPQTPQTPHSHSPTHTRSHSHTYTSSAPHPSAPLPIANAARKRRTSSTTSELATPQTPSIIGMMGPRKRSSYYDFLEHDLIPLERGGSTEGRRRSSVFSLGEPGVPVLQEEPSPRAESSGSSVSRDARGKSRATSSGSGSWEPEREAEREQGAKDERAVETILTETPEVEEGDKERELPPIPGSLTAPPPPIPPTHVHPNAHPGPPQIAAPTPRFVPYGPLPDSNAGSTTRSFSATLRRRIDRSKTLSLLRGDSQESEVAPAPSLPPLPFSPSPASPSPASAPSVASHPSVPSPAPTPASLASASGTSALSMPAASSSSSPYAYAPPPTDNNTTGRYKRKLKSLIKATRRRRAQSLSTLSSGASANIAMSHTQSPPHSMAQTPSTTFTLPTPSHSFNSLPASAPDSRSSSFRASVREYPSLNTTNMNSTAAMTSLSPSPLGLSLPLGTPLDMSLAQNSLSLSRITTPRRMHPRAMSLPHHPFNVVLTSAGLQPVNSDELVWGTLSYRAPARTDYFTSRLPRELKVKVFKALLDSYAAHPGTGRWDGINAGRKELVRLSCVSKEWRSLCFDGQLWAVADFTPFAAVMHPGTVREILLHARPCVKELNVRGLDAITGWSLTVRELDMSPTALPPTIFSSLTTLDLFGCHDLTPKDVVALVSVSPNLKRLNLKGSRLSLGHVLSAIASHVTALEELDISRCWSLEFLDVEAWIASLSVSQKAALKSLRIAGLTSTTGGHLMRRIGTDLPNLSTLDLLNCRWLGALDLRDYIAALPEGGPSPLTHLVISGCTNLTTDALELLIDKLPHMTHFEAAGLEPVFYLDPPPTLARLVRTMPKLVRLDLDSTGRYGGVCDRLLDELIPGAVNGSPLVESQLVELRIGGAKNVTAAGILRLVSALPKLSKLEVDGTEADNAVLRAFLSRPRPQASISLIDCHRVTHDVYTVVSSKTRARAGWDDYRGTVFAYTDKEVDDTKAVVKTFWAWRAVRPPKLWREARLVGEMGGKEISDRQVIVKSAWWRSEDVDDIERGACIVM